ncbi:MAG TPA: hypothetical protein PLB28_07470 [Bacteroidales bacterium]|nr:hypothetical protein [Bacteroidales bacterium]
MDEELIKNTGEAQTPAEPLDETPAEPIPAEPEATADPAREQINTIISEFMSGGEPTPENELKVMQMFKNLHDKLLVGVENDPAFGEALNDIFQGETARVALARAYGPDAFTAEEGDPDYEKMGKAFTDAQGRIAKKKETASMIAKNQEMSVKEITSWMEEKGYDDAGIQARLKKMEEIRQDFLNDKITKQHLELIDKAMDFDQAVSNAEEAGKVAGRNENIVTSRKKEKLATDGLPSLTSSGAKAKPSKPKSLLQSLHDENE